MVGFLITAVSLMVLLDSVWWWQADRFARQMPQRRRWRWGVSVFMVAQVIGLLSILLGRYLFFDARDWMPLWLMIFLFKWHLLVLPATIVLWLIFTAGWSVTKVIQMLTRSRAAVAEPVDTGPREKFGLTRRQFLAAAAVSTPPLVTIVGGGSAIAKLSDFRIRRMDVPFANLPRDLDGLTIAHVSDVHVGDFTSGETLLRIAEATNNLEPDLILMTGDLLNRALADLPAALDMVQRMDSRFGLFMCEGNHDLFEGRSAFEQGVKASGVPLLVNETRSLVIRGTDVQLFGLRWGMGGPRSTRSQDRADSAIESSLNALLPQANPNAFQILLAHHPHAMDFAAKAGIPLTLSGHTHGGQLHLTENIGFGPFMYKYWSGLYRVGGSTGIISNGVGNWFPLRINAPAEIIHLTLRRA